MTDFFEMQPACPSTMSVRRAGDGIVAAPEGISSGSFLVQMLLS
ncbi:MAG TPA: cupin domain-containing protein, partial [Agrobacterium sp.]|nr:cupin domain-containing protein [Agrobacterium sp.]